MREEVKFTDLLDEYLDAKVRYDEELAAVQEAHGWYFWERESNYVRKRMEAAKAAINEFMQAAAAIRKG